MDKPLQVLSAFVENHISGASLAEQIRICSAMAIIAPTPAERRRWEEQEANLEQIARNHDQLWFNFRGRRS